MTNSPEQFKPEENAKERINNPELAEGMAHAGKPYRDESIRRAKEAQEEIDYIHSDEYREERRQTENQDIGERLENTTKLSDSKSENGFSADLVENFVLVTKNSTCWCKKQGIFAISGG